MLLKNGHFVTSNETVHGDMLIEGGRIKALDSSLENSSDGPTHDLAGKMVVPGAIDAHVHFNEPGRADWEGWETGSRAALAGGTTTVFEMPLNANPPTLTPELFTAKQAVAREKSCIDFGLWGGLTPINLEHIHALAECGVIGFKAFMSNSGLDDFPRSATETLRKGMELIAQTGKILALHAEDEALTQKLAREARAKGLDGPAAWLYSRPVEAELLAIREALDLARDTGCRIHIVHISNAPGFDMVHEARAAGVDVTAETCPHYLDLTEDALNKHGALAKCAPPLRDAFTRDCLWEKVINGSVDTYGSDHSPCLTSMKTDVPFSKAWGGISGIQHSLNPLIDRVLVHGDLSWQTLVKISSRTVAARFGLSDRGRIEAGLKADLVIIDPDAKTECRAENLLYCNAHSPYVGKSWQGRISDVVLNGELIVSNQRPSQRGKPC